MYNLILFSVLVLLVFTAYHCYRKLALLCLCACLLVCTTTFSASLICLASNCSCNNKNNTFFYFFLYVYIYIYTCLYVEPVVMCLIHAPLSSQCPQSDADVVYTKPVLPRRHGKFVHC